MIGHQEGISIFCGIGECRREGGALCRRGQSKKIRERHRGTYREEW
mgnify:CR=1 FL=1